MSEGWRGWSARRSDDAAHCHFLIEQMREALRNSVLSVTLTDGRRLMWRNEAALRHGIRELRNVRYGGDDRDDQRRDEAAE